MNLKQFREKTLGTVVRLLPKPTFNGQPIRNEHNTWLVIDEVQDAVFLLQNRSTRHEIQLGADNIQEFRTPNLLILRGQLLLKKAPHTEFEPLPPGLVGDERLQSLTANPTFALDRGYGNPNEPNFGRNDLSAQLGEYRIIDLDRNIEKAESWFSLLIEPIASSSISIDIAGKALRPNDFYKQGSEPYEKFAFPQGFRTTFDSILMYSGDDNKGLWHRFLKIDKTGNIEYADTRNSICKHRGLRIFNFVQIIGVAWQLLFLAKNILLEAGYQSEIQFTFNMVGTRHSILGGFSQVGGPKNQIWRDPLVDPFGLVHFDDRNKCADANLKIDHNIPLNSLAYDESLNVIKTIARRVELAYNHHESPRCFNVDTDVFPWTQYTNTLHF